MKRKTDKEKIALYMELTLAIVTAEPGKWEISTPEETISFGSYGDLMENIQDNLTIMLDIYTANGEMDEWIAVSERAGIHVDWKALGGYNQ